LALLGIEGAKLDLKLIKGSQHPILKKTIHSALLKELDEKLPKGLNYLTWVQRSDGVFFLETE
jgi:hypothetical protein